jgi:hypothetical protein
LRISLSHIFRIKNFRVLLWHNDHLYGSRRYSLHKIEVRKLLEDQQIKIEKIGEFMPDIFHGLSSRSRLLSRLTRTGFHGLEILKDGKLVAVLSKHIAILEPGETIFKSVFTIKRGTRPLGIATTPDGSIYWGEYFDNNERDEVYIYGSQDSGRTWEVVYRFPKGTIRHIHSIVYDQFDNCFWVVTGDEDIEPRILRASVDWKIVETVLEGDQQSRTVTLIIRTEGIYYATDTPHEQNHIYLLERNGSRRKLCQTSGPSMWSCEVGDVMFFSTASEPGNFYYPFVCIYGSTDGDKWERLIEWPKDGLHPKYFQYGNVILPRGKNSHGLLAATGIAVKREDNALNLWKIITS